MAPAPPQLARSQARQAAEPTHAAVEVEVEVEPIEAPVLDRAPDRRSTPAAPTSAPRRAGAFEAYSIGDPGRAARYVVPRPAPLDPGQHDTIVDGVTIEDEADEPRLEVRAASIRGLAHRQEGLVRQDDYLTALTPDRSHLVIAVADGLASGDHSHVAARVAVRQGADRLCELLATVPTSDVPWDDLLQQLSSLIIGVAATTQQVPLDAMDAHAAAKLMATTLVLAVVSVAPDDDGTHDVRAIRVGDSSAWVLRSGSWVSLGAIKNDEATISESATLGLPHLPSVPVAVYRARLAIGEALLLMSDGVGDPLDGGRGEVGSTLANLWARPPAPLAFAAQVDFARRTYDDDRTAVGVWPVDPSGRG
jgi:serine/threonine protein phosphatase PrpC